jgi:hypothetical protein
MPAEVIPTEVEVYMAVVDLMYCFRLALHLFGMIVPMWQFAVVELRWSSPLAVVFAATFD